MSHPKNETNKNSSILVFLIPSKTSKAAMYIVLSKRFLCFDLGPWER